MKYDFETLVDRSQNGSAKWNGMKDHNPAVAKNIAPLSVADLDLKLAPEIAEGMLEFMQNNPVFGYTNGTAAYYDAVINWMNDKHNYQVEKEWIVLSNGVVPALSDGVTAFTEENDGVIIFTPVYYPFYRAIELNNILGGIAFYQVSEDKISIIKVNDIFYHITKINPADFENIRDRIIEFVHPDDQNEFISLFDQAYQNPISGSEATIRYYSLKGEVSWISLRVFFLRKQDKSLIFYGAMNDVTKNNLQEQELNASKQTINQLLGFPEDTAVEDYLNYQDSQTAVSMFSKVVPAGILGCYRTKELPIYFINREMLSLLNLTTMEEFNLFCKGQIINIIHPEDHQTVYAAIGLEEDEGFEYTVRYRIMKKDQTWLWVQEKGRIVKAKDGLLAYICAIVDINETMSSKIELEKINQQLIKQKQQLSFLNECTLGGYFHLAKTNNI